MNIAIIKSALYSWAVDALGGASTVVWDEVRGPRPSLPFARLKIVSGPLKLGSFDEVLDTESEDVFNIVERRAFNISVQVFGGDATQLASDMLSSLSKAAVINSLDVAGISVFSEGSVTDVASLLETKFEPRAQFDLGIYHTSTLADTVGEIQTVEATSTIGDESGSITSSQS